MVIASGRGHQTMSQSESESGSVPGQDAPDASHGREYETSGHVRLYAIPRQFTNYDRNAHTWRDGTAQEIFDRAAKPLIEDESASD